ncbi:hypothetical protein VH98_06310 [Acinetobacter brisouii]|nr:hypothetical protein VH98_06310 [Acinetobacter brisouii]
MRGQVIGYFHFCLVLSIVLQLFFNAIHIFHACSWRFMVTILRGNSPLSLFDTYCHDNQYNLSI